MKTTARIHYLLAHVVLAGVALQYLLAGLGVFGAASFDWHVMVGYLVALVALLTLMAALVSGRARGWTAALTVAALVQIALPHLRDSAPAVAALHVLNAGFLLFAAAAVFRGAPPSLRAVERSGDRTPGRAPAAGPAEPGT